MKANNVMLMRRSRTEDPYKNPHVVVIDLGVAERFQPENFTEQHPTGTPCTMAPEVWSGTLTFKADIFSCGCILYELLALRLPFAFPPLPPGVKTAAKAAPTALAYWNSLPSPDWRRLEAAGVSKDAVALCKSMLQHNRDARPAAGACLRNDFLSVKEKCELPAFLLRGLATANKRSMLHKGIAFAVGRNWPPHRVSAIKHLFEEIDADGSGRLEKTRVALALEKMGMTEARARSAADAMDLSRDGSVTWGEFMAACVPLGSDMQEMEKDLKKVFDQADRNKDGQLSHEDIVQLVSEVYRAEHVYEFLEGALWPTFVDWPAFRSHFRESLGREDGVEAFGGLLLAVGLGDDFWSHTRSRIDKVMESIFGAKEAREDVLQMVANLGFTDREVCAAVLKRHQNDLASPGLLTELKEKHPAQKRPSGSRTPTRR
jgi:hypothetical protein